MKFCLFVFKTGTNSTSCGPINKDRGIQRLEAMLFAIDKINRDPKLLKNIKLGAIILDTCSSDTYALNQSLEFIRASINTVEASAFECSDGATPRPKYGWKHITGVVGGSYSEASLLCSKEIFPNSNNCVRVSIKSNLNRTTNTYSNTNKLDICL